MSLHLGIHDGQELCSHLCRRPSVARRGLKLLGRGDFAQSALEMSVKKKRVKESATERERDRERYPDGDTDRYRQRDKRERENETDKDSATDIPEALLRIS